MALVEVEIGRAGSDASVADRLIEVAEALLGRHGLEGVSLRQIAVAAGTANNNAVQYHFRDANGLIQAILRKRAPRIELARGRLLAKIKTRNELTTASLLNALLRPLIDHLNDQGERALARFMVVLLTSPAGDEHLERMGHIDDLLPRTGEILDLLHDQNPELTVPLLRERVRIVALMVFNSLFNRSGHYSADHFDEDLMENALDMASAAVGAKAGNYMTSLSQATTAS